MLPKNTELLGNVIRQVLKEKHLDTALYERQAIAAWSELLGKNVMQYTSKLYIQKKILYVYVTSSVLRHNLFLSRYDIKKKLNDYVGVEVIQDIIFR